MFAYLPPSAINHEQFRKFYNFLQNLLSRQTNYIYIYDQKLSSSLNDDQEGSLFRKTTFKENFATQTFLEQSAPFPPKPKKTTKFWQCHLKAEGHSISEHTGVIPWPTNLMKKFLCELRQYSFTAPKMHFYSTSGLKPCLPTKKKKHNLKLLTPLEWYDRDFFLAWCWGVNIFWFLG